MNEIIIIGKILVVILMIIKLMSSASKEDKEVITHTKKIIDDLKSSENAHLHELATQEEINKLNSVYHISITSPVKVFYVKDDVFPQKSDINDQVMLMIGGVSAQIPPSLYDIFRLGGESELFTGVEDSLKAFKLALVEDKLYIISLGNYELFKDERPESYTEITVETKDVVKSPLKVLRERNASENECLYRDPIKKGSIYPLLMCILFILAPIYVDETKSVLVWEFVYGSITIVGLVLWYKFYTRKRKTYKVTSMHGHLVKIEIKGSRHVIRILDKDKKSTKDFTIPYFWFDKIQGYCDQDIYFEVYSNTNTIVSIGSEYSIEKHARCNPSSKELPYAGLIATFLILSVSVFFNMDLGKAKLALSMQDVVGVKQINSIDDWKLIDQRGQRVQINNMYLSCASAELSAKSKQTWTLNCDNLNVTSEPSTHNDFLAIAKPTINELKLLDDRLDFEQMDKANYEKLKEESKGKNNNSSNITYTLIPRLDIFTYKKPLIKNWANFIVEHDLIKKELQDSLYSMWKKISSENCFRNCWDFMMVDLQQDDNNESSELNIITHEYVAPFMKIKATYIKQLVKHTMAKLSNMPVSESQIQVQFVDSLIATEKLKKLVTTVNSNKQSSANVYAQQLEDAITEMAALNDNKTSFYGVVSKIDNTNNIRRFVIDSEMTAPLFNIYLTKMSIILFGLLATLVVMFFMLRRGNKKVKVLRG